MTVSRKHTPTVTPQPKIALVLQGGGALGAYHIGAYQAMQEAGYEPDWIAGISIGAINSAILAGNAPEDRVPALEALWDEITRPDFGIGYEALNALPLPFQRGANSLSSLGAFTLGQPNFFQPRFPSPVFVPPDSVATASYYDTTPMLRTLAEHADFELIQHGDTRLSLGATDVESGELVFFDNAQQVLTPAHVLASGSLPPAFPAVEVDGRWYWDGGCVSNTPLEAIMRDLPPGPLLVFAVDLWSASGRLPVTMDEVSWRQKEIQYASRTAQHIRSCAQTVNLCRAQGVRAHVDPATTDRCQASALQFNDALDIVHITYRSEGDHVSTSDAEFSRSSIAERRAAGYRDMQAALRDGPWRKQARQRPAAAVHTVCQGKMLCNVSLR